MDFFTILRMIGGLVLFLYGIQKLGEGLKKVSGGKLEQILETLTSNKIKAVLLGTIVTAIIQSSGATIVMVVGFVNSEIMTLSRAVGVILGANIGTTVTAWLLSLTGIQSDNIILAMFKPENFSPIIGLIGVFMLMMSKSERRRDFGAIMTSFAVLMLGMDMMSSSAAPLAQNERFISILTMFANPILGLLAGLIMTAILQSSSASIGILQALSVTGTVSIGTAIPILMGENIGSAITGVLSSVGSSRNARRAAMLQMYYCLIKTMVFMGIFYLVHAIVHFAFMSTAANPVMIAVFHSVFNITAVVLMLPFSDVLVKLVEKTIPVVEQEKMVTDRKEKLQILDEHFLTSPSFALEQSMIAAMQMTAYMKKAVRMAVELLSDYSQERADEVEKLEQTVDRYDDQLNSYLVKVSRYIQKEKDSHTLNTLLHCIGDFERITDHALNIMETAGELHNSKKGFSESARIELEIFAKAMMDILDKSVSAFEKNDLKLARSVEPLESVIDALNAETKQRHISRLRNGECTIELGLILSDLITDYERIADHCSNVAVCLLEVSKDGFDTHDFLERVWTDEQPEFRRMVEEYEEQYRLPEVTEL